MCDKFIYTLQQGGMHEDSTQESRLIPSFRSSKKEKEGNHKEEEEEEEDEDDDAPREDLAWLEQGCISSREPQSPITGSDCAADEHQQMEAAFTSRATVYVSEGKLYWNEGLKWKEIHN